MSTYAVLAVLFLSAMPRAAETEGEPKEKSKASGGSMDFNLYPHVEVETDNVFTINAFAKLPNRFSYFSLTNFGNQADRDELSDTVSFYTEQNLRWALPANIPFDLTLQWNPRSGDNNDRLRLGTRWKAPVTPGIKNFFEAIDMTYTLNFHVVQLDHMDDYLWQMEHVYRINILPDILNDRLYIGGFADHSFGGPGDPEVVNENQLGVRLYDWWYAVAEYRYNGYRKGDESSLGLGFEYVIKF